MDENGWIFIFGIVAGVTSYFTKNFIFQPLLEFREVRGRVQNRLKYNANKIHIGERNVLEEVSKEFRQLSCDLEEKYYAISLKSLLSKIGILPEISVVSEAARNLIFLSNRVGSDDFEHTYKAIDQIKTALKVI